MKIFETAKIKELDQAEVSFRGITSYDLMNRAVSALFGRIKEMGLLSTERKFYIIAGPGNNGGDALVLARLLLGCGCSVTVRVVSVSGKLSADCKSALDDLTKDYPQDNIITDKFEPFCTDDDDVIIDALFGAGLNRRVEGVYAQYIKHINESGCEVWSIDMPSGLMGEDNRENDPSAIVRPDRLFTFSFPKVSFFMRENEEFIPYNNLEIIDIGLADEVLDSVDSSFYFDIEEKDNLSVKKDSRAKVSPSVFSHKGTFGHGLLIAGSYGMMGAAVLSAKAAILRGCGLLTVHLPRKCCDIMQISVPEAVVQLDGNEERFTSLFPELGDVLKYSAVGVGPGLKTGEETSAALRSLLENYKGKMVIDADALNILSMDKTMLELLPKNAILTPHPKEFDRLTSPSSCAYERLQKQIEFAKKYKVIVVLKGAFTSIAFPDGRCTFSSVADSRLSVAGSGDVLTGIILSMLAQGFDPFTAAVKGVYEHGHTVALADQHGMRVRCASDLLDHIDRRWYD